jgi:hypothetical protein
MTVRVDVPIRQGTESNQHRQPNAQSNTNFRSQLGLDSQREQVQNAIMRGDKELSLEPTVADALVAAKQLQVYRGAQQPEATAVQLYPLSWHAVHHLSYVAHSYSGNDPETTGQTNSLVLPAQPQANMTLMPELAAQATWEDGTAPVVRTSNANPAQPKYEIDSSNAIVGNSLLPDYLASQWPLRRIQLMQVGTDIHVLVRDYQLSPTEIDDLTAKLLAYMAEQGDKKPDCIWVNGQSVWTAAQQSTSFLRGNHGS